MITIHFKKLHPDAIPFKYNYEDDACMDMYALEDIILKHDETYVIKTGIAIELPKGYEGQVRGRSGLSSNGILVHLGTIDEGYRGDIGVIVTNTGYSDTPSRNFRINKGDRIGQFSIHPVYKITLKEVNDLSLTNRGTNGYGSSGS